MKANALNLYGQLRCLFTLLQANEEEFRSIEDQFNAISSLSVNPDEPISETLLNRLSNLIFEIKITLAEVRYKAKEGSEVELLTRKIFPAARELERLLQNKRLEMAQNPPS